MPLKTVSTGTFNEWLDKLAQKESGGRCDIKVMDVNKRYSYGAYMFQMATWLEQGKKYDIHTTERNIYDCSLQRELVTKMITDNYNNWSHWECSVIGCEKYNIIGIGKPPKI
jgi:hypothetical protein